MGRSLFWLRHANRVSAGAFDGQRRQALGGRPGPRRPPQEAENAGGAEPLDGRHRAPALVNLQRVVADGTALGMIVTVFMGLVVVYVVIVAVVDLDFNGLVASWAAAGESRCFVGGRS